MTTFEERRTQPGRADLWSRYRWLVVAAVLIAIAIALVLVISSGGGSGGGGGY
jgi:hypothetical protein